LQVDKQVLQALPDDMRTDIEEALSLRAKHHHKETTKDVVERREAAGDLCHINDDEQPECSHWTRDGDDDDDDDDAASVSAAKKSCTTLSLPSYAQVLHVA